MSDPGRETFERFVRLVLGDQRGYLCVFAGDRQGGKLANTETEYFPYPHTIANAWGWVKRRSDAGKETYFVPHLLTAKRRIKENAAPLHVLYADGDGAPIPTGALKPHIIVESSPGRWQGFWILPQDLDPAVGEALNHRLTECIGADPGGWDLGQLLRIVGTNNHKRTELFTVHLAEIDERAPVDTGDLDRILPQAGAPARASRLTQGAGVALSGDEPPVALSERGARLWSGELRIVKSDDSGEIDRSETVFALASDLWQANATQSAIVSALQNRDAAWGWGYEVDKPGDFARIAAKIAASKPRQAADNRGESGAPAPADHARLAAQLDQVMAECTELRATVESLRVRVKNADEQLAVYRNPKLGAARQTAAALIPIFRAKPDKSNHSAGYRVPLKRLARETGLSAEACSRQIRQLATYTVDDGSPLLHWELVDVPAGTDGRTGEIDGRPTGPHKELWIGPGAAPDKWAEYLANASPPERKAWGGKRDDVCNDHPADGVIERQRDQRIVTYECANADCRHVIEERVIPIGRPKARTLDRIPRLSEASALLPNDAKRSNPARGNRGAGQLGFAQQLTTPMTAEEEAAALAAWSRGAPPTPEDRWSS